MNGNKKIAKKIVAGSMAVMMAAGLAGTYEYHNNVMQVQAAEQKDKDTQELKETAENVLADHATDSEDTGFSKEESVYVKADASGNVKKTTVSEWLKNPEKGTISDTSELKDIKNVKGDETFETGSNNNVSWKSEGNDIYYQGTIDKELPVDVKVSYKLDGKSISPKDLKGKSGKVEIQFSYDNKSKQTVNVNGEDVEMYTPFTMVSAMMLSSDEYSNVSVENGKLISDGDKNIVVGVAFPGLANDLNLKDLDMDIDIPETVTITADVKDATVGTSITMASAELMNEFGLDDIDSFDDLQDSIDDLEDATNQLVDGSKEAADGSKELADGAGTLNDGAGTLASGAGTLASGVQAYTGGVEEIYAGSNDLVSGAQALASGADTLNTNIASAADGANSLVAGAQSLKNGLKTAKDTLDEGVKVLNNVTEENIKNSVTATVSTDKVTASVNKPEVAAIVNQHIDENTTAEEKEAITKAVEDALEQCTASVDKDSIEVEKTVNGNAQLITQSVKGAQDYMNGVGTSLTQSSGSKEQPSVWDGVNGIESGASTLAGYLGLGDGKTLTIGTGAAGLASGSKKLLAGTQKLQAGASQLHDNSAPLMAGVTSLKDGGSQLASGVSQLASGANQVADGAGTLSNGTQTLLDGANTLADGNQTLADGMQEYKEEAIDKLTDLFNGDISGVTDRIDAMTNLAKEYKSFAGISDGVSGTTKFIIETEGIDD